MTIERWKGSAKGRNCAVRHDGIVYTVATGPGAYIQAQTRPQRACVGAPLAGDKLVEIVVTAAAKSS